MSKSWVPNSFTLANLVFGIFSIYYSFHQEYSIASYLIVAALIADAFDGRAARALGVSGDFGKELDSLCDGVSFGVAPAFLMYHYAQLEQFSVIGVIAGLLFAICGILRLARFNTMTDTVKGYFLGMPIPSGGCLVATYVLADLGIPSIVSLVLLFIWGPLMVSTFKFPDFKGGDTYKMNKVAIGISAVVAIALVAFSLKAIGFAIFFGYMVFGMLNTFLGATKTN